MRGKKQFWGCFVLARHVHPDAVLAMTMNRINAIKSN
jgi:hypothetical protein